MWRESGASLIDSRTIKGQPLTRAAAMRCVCVCGRIAGNETLNVSQTTIHHNGSLLRQDVEHGRLISVVSTQINKW